MTAERGQAAVEFVALLLLTSIAFAALLAVGRGYDGRSIGGFLANHVVCAVSGRCDKQEHELAGAYGERDAERVRALAPNLVYEGGERQLPVDWRDCRRIECAAAPDDRSLDAHVADGGGRATAFTRVIRRNGRLYVAYWLYYPESNSVLAGSDRLWERSWLLPRVRRLVEGTADYPGFHRDDWEAIVLRVDPDGKTWARASSHGHWQGCKWGDCADSWIRATGWVRISRGSHSGHLPYRRLVPPAPRAPGPRLYLPESGPPRHLPLIPGRDLDERSTTAEGIRLVPLETLRHGDYFPLDPDVKPPWQKRAYGDPESDES